MNGIQSNWLNVVLAIIVTIAGYVLYERVALTDFDLHTVTDMTSSGGTRVSTADLHFSDTVLVSGTGTYQALPGMGGSLTYTCTYKNGIWTPAESSTTTCDIFIDLPISVSQFKQQIADKKMMPKETCKRFATCYTIKKMRE